MELSVEGFFIERFINICMNKKIFLWNLRRQKGTIVKIRIGLSDFKQIRQIAKQTKSKIKIEQKRGLPFLINRYKKRKIFAITFLVIAILIFLLTRYIWNIEINGLVNIPKEEILLELKNNGIDIGKKISTVNTESIINQIRVNRNDIAWIGIDLKGTNAIIEIVEAEEKPEIIDENKICNIIAKKDGIITKVNVQKGTGRVITGDAVKVGDLLVEGVMEGKYTGNRYVHSQANIYAKVWYTNEKTASLTEEHYTQTGRVENKFQIKINNFKINLNKGVSKFEKYDTMCSNNKIKLFSNLYIPVEIVKISYFETQKHVKEYTIEELTNKLKKELEDELIEELKLEENKILEKNYTTYNDKNNVYVKLILVVEEEIGESIDINY